MAFLMSRNATPMSRLPPEVLSLIFCYVLHDTTDHESIFDNPQADQPSLVKRWPGIIIAHVCHMWREVAMGTSSLWSYLFLSRRNHKWIKECFRRSKEAPCLLSMDLSKDGNRPHKPVKALLHDFRNHLGRCRVLSLRLNHRDLIDFLSNTEAPCLVDFQCSRVIYQSSGKREQKPVIFGDSTLHADSLRRLSITAFAVDWGASFFHRLVHLKLASIPNKLKCRGFVSFLAGIPSLEVLDLRNFIRPRSPGDLPATTLHIQHLKHLELNGKEEEIAELLSNIIVPRSCKVFINVGSHSTGGAFQRTISWVHNLYHPSYHDWTSLRLFHLKDHFGVQGSVQGNFTQDELFFEKRTIHYEESIAEILLDSLPINHIVYLEHSGHSSILSRGMWLLTFGPIETLESICVDAPSGSLFRALSYDPGASDDIPFPALSSITMRGNEDHSPDYSAMLTGLRWRLGLGVPLPRLVIQDCSKMPPSFVVKQLKEVVEQVEIEEPA